MRGELGDTWWGYAGPGSAWGEMLSRQASRGRGVECGAVYISTAAATGEVLRRINYRQVEKKRLTCENVEGHRVNILEHVR
jgi:hypothetical protein